jgi:hypothetical protein
LPDVVNVGAITAGEPFVVTAPVATLVAPTLAGAAETFVTGAAVATVDAAVNAFVAAATATPPPTASPAPLVMTGVGAELIEEFTVCCGLAISDGFWNWPVIGAGP